MRYATGGPQVAASDLTVPAPGLFGHYRAYGAKTDWDYDGPNGYNWHVAQLPYATCTGDAVAVVFDSNNPYWFARTGGGFQPMFGQLDATLTEDAGAGTLTFTNTAGARQETTVLNSLSAPAAPGRFVSHTDARGVQTTIAAATGDRIDELQRSYAVGGVTVVESIVYGYYASGSATDKIETVSYRKKVGAGSWADVKRVANAYYGSGDANGGVNDLKTAAQQRPDGSGGWEDVSVEYHRYYLGGEPTGFAHGLKLQFGPESYRALWNSLGSQAAIDAASDATIKPYADHYFEYDPTSRAVTELVAAVCSSCVGGGTTSDSFSYTTNPSYPGDGYGIWKTRAEQTLPDGSKIIVYSNYAGMTILYVVVDPAGTRQWVTFARYDDAGRQVWKAHPSAVTGYDDAYPDLLNYDPGTGLYQYLRDNDGLIEVTDRYAGTGGGAVDGYVQYRNVRQGQAGTDVRVGGYTYTSNTDASGATIYPVATSVGYPDDATTATTITTGYAYSFHSGTNQFQQRTTTPPVVSSGQNGSGATYTVVEAFDTYGNLTSRTDERGFVNEYAYDVVMSVMTRQTLNVQSGVTAPGVNVVSDFEHDDQGRPTQTLGPSHAAVVGGSATTVRSATWNVYVASARPSSGTWGPDENRSGQGYATGSGPSYTYTLINPVSLTRTDKDGRALDQITSKRTSGSGKLSPSDTFAQADWKSWGSTQYNDRHQTISSRVYHLIPSSGTGSVGTNYGQADYGYDVLERRNRVVSPGGTITRTVWTTPQWVLSTWVGTDDTGATDDNPAGSGSPNNMVVVSENEYDGGAAGGDGNLTQVTQYASASDARVTGYGYDFRDRRISQDGEIDVYVESFYDNLDRLTRTDRRDTTSGGNLIGRSESRFDDRSRVYQTLTYAVDPATGVVGNALVGDAWYDPSGNPIQRVGEGDGQVFTKTAYNGVGWVTASYRGYNTAGVSYAQATTVANDTIFEQSQSTYDEAGNVLSAASFQRLNDAPATGTGSTGPLTSTANPKARVSYAATWYDGIGRAFATAAYGAVSSFTRPSTPPARSDTELVTTTEYDDAGRAWKSVDPRGIEGRTAFDAAGRTTQTIEAYSTSAADDLNRTTNFTYTLDNLIATMTAVNARTGDQTTTWTYGTTLAESEVARNDLLRYTDYPGSVSGSDRTAVSYNRLGQRRTFTDQRGTVHTYFYDKLGRPTNDCVTTDGTGTDVSVKQIITAYEVRGMVSAVTSTDDPAQGAGTALNQCAMTYNDFMQLTDERQEHSGAVGGSTPGVQYAYADGSANQVRLVTLTYPDGRVITYDYGSSGGPDDRLSRVKAIKDGSVVLSSYTYLGLS